LGFDGQGEFYCLDDVLKGLKVNMEQFVNSCIIAGCDYLKNVRGIGIHKAFDLQTKHGEAIFTVLAQKGAAKDYEKKFIMAKAVFCHQTVIDPVEVKTVPLKDWPTPPSRQLQHYCGEYPL
jgi:flap endonuclease-1